MAETPKFAKIGEVADGVSGAEQETFHCRRLQLTEDVQKARLEFQRGETVETTTGDLMEEILAWSLEAPLVENR